MASQGSLELCVTELMNAVYRGATLFERFEHMTNSEGKSLIRGNGHHAAQQIAEMAKQELLSRWENKAEVEAYKKQHPQ